MNKRNYNAYQDEENEANIEEHLLNNNLYSSKKLENKQMISMILSKYRFISIESLDISLFYNC